VDCREVVEEPGAETLKGVLMSNHDSKLRPLVAACSIALLTLAGPAFAQTSNGTANTRNDTTHANAATSQGLRGDARDEAKGATDDVNQAVGVIRRMQADPGAANLLADAQGVFIVPKYGRAALGIGGRGGVGVLLLKENGNWSDPAFYNFGGMSAGVEAGVEGGSFVLVLNDQKAVDSFRQNNNWSLNAGAGLTIVEWSKKARASAGRGDVTVWSDVKGLFGGAQVAVTDIKYDADQTAAYYGQTGKVALSDVLDNKVSNVHADRLKQVLASAGETSNGSASVKPVSPTAAAMSPAGTYSSTTPDQANADERIAPGASTANPAEPTSPGTYGSDASK
jgi:lipid-binding SYLF domain-containing protein